MTSPDTPPRETAWIAVCVPASLPSAFEDDVYGDCAICTRGVRFPPSVPARRVLICCQCYYKHAGPNSRCDVLHEAMAELHAIGIDV